MRVPEGMQGLFAQAEELVSGYFRQRREDPGQGLIEICGERYVLVRAASLSVGFFELVRDLYGPGRQAEADDFARNILFDLAHSIGRADARRFHARMKLVDPIARLAAGPVHFAHTGWAFVDIHPDSNPVAGEDYVLVYDHPYSFEAHAWLESKQEVTSTVCIMNAGYSSGWCQESFGLPLVASEILCRARGDEACRFIMAPPARIEACVQRYLRDRPPAAGRAATYQIPDFFARKRIEEELRLARDELEQRVVERTAELERANRRLREEMLVRQQMEDELLQSAKLEAIGRLAGGIVHDFNNLMGVVVGQASLLEHSLPDGSSLQGMAHEIRQTGQEAAQLTQQLLSFSHAHLRSTELVDLSALVRGTTSLLKRLLGEHVELSLELDDAAGAVRGDRGQLTQVVMNLALNARDAMPAGGRLRIRTSRLEAGVGTPQDGRDAPPGSWAVLEVADTGMGMDEQTLARAFEPFFTTKGPGGGTGLGLPTVSRVVTRAGGMVSVTSTPGGGTTFRIRLPRAAERGETAGAVEPARPVPRGRETILVVEDLPSLRRMLVGMLEAQGYTVLDAVDPEEALRMAAVRTQPIDLLLTDVVMPRMNGRELADRVVEVRPELPVLFISGYPDDDVLRCGVEKGAAALLAKPFTAEQLARRVRGLLDGRAAGGVTGRS